MENGSTAQHSSVRALQTALKEIESERQTERENGRDGEKGYGRSMKPIVQAHSAQ